MRKKTILFVIALLIVILVCLGFFLQRKNSTPQNTLNKISLPTSTTAQPTAIATPTNNPYPPTLALGTKHGIVTINNPHRIALSSDEGVEILRQTDEYSLAYDSPANTFLIYTLKTKLDPATRTLAENDLLKILGINQTDACKLALSTLVPHRSPESSWSFCPPGV